MRRLSPEKKAEMAKIRESKSFKKKIRDVFTNAGFDYINTEGKNVRIGSREVEVDAVFFYENILLICEDTTGKTHIKDHIRKKEEAFGQIRNNFDNYYKWLSEKFPEKAEYLKKYNADRYQLYCLYFSRTGVDLSSEDLERFPNIKFIEPKILNYLHQTAKCIKKSARYEIFRFLGIETDAIGPSSSGSGSLKIKASIIYPKGFTGLENGVRVVSFMINAEFLIKTCYVLRKDSWEESAWLYQRLVDKTKIKNIRGFLHRKSTAFYNNIIVGLPDEVRFLDQKGDYVSIEKLQNLPSCILEIPEEINSICVIDGQHRIYAHYEGTERDDKERKISELRKNLHLLVTGLIFPTEMSGSNRAKIQSEIFLEINSTAKPIPADVLLHIKTLKDPYSDVGLARQVIESLNKDGVFKDKFGLTSLDETKIKVASIIKFALRYLVTIDPAQDASSFFTYWDGDKNALKNRSNEEVLGDYVKFCAGSLKEYFNAVYKKFKSEWNDPSSKILSVISINGFIIAFTRQLKRNGIKDFAFYDESLRGLTLDFSKDGFPYTSSQYRKFSNDIVKVWGL